MHVEAPDDIQKFRVIQSNNRGLVCQKGDCTYASRGPAKGEEFFEMPTLFLWVNRKTRLLARCWTQWTGEKIEKDFVYCVTKFRNIVDLNGETRFHLWCSQSVRLHLWSIERPSVHPIDIESIQKKLFHESGRHKSGKYLRIREDRVKEQTPPLSEPEIALMKKLYSERDSLNHASGFIKYHVDHIVPLAKGGLNHPSNLRIILATDNCKKGAKLLN